jgi:hypothetical protein
MTSTVTSSHKAPNSMPVIYNLEGDPQPQPQPPPAPGPDREPWGCQYSPNANTLVNLGKRVAERYEFLTLITYDSADRYSIQHFIRAIERSQHRDVLRQIVRSGPRPGSVPPKHRSVHCRLRRIASPRNSSSIERHCCIGSCTEMETGIGIRKSPSLP